MTTITTQAYGEIGETVYLDGVEIGDVFGNFAQPKGIRAATYRFADRDAAIAACVSYALRGFWTGEL